jgi:hypothetical protein
MGGRGLWRRADVAVAGMRVCLRARDVRGSVPRRPGAAKAWSCGHGFGVTFTLMWEHKRGARGGRAAARLADPVAFVREGFGNPKPPHASQIWQKAFDYDPGHLHALASLQPGERPEPGHLYDYALDVKYEEIQRDLFLYVFPFCLQAWQDAVSGRTHAYDGFIEELYPGLVRGRVFAVVLSPAEVAVVSEFMRNVILGEIDRQTEIAFSGCEATAYRWFYALSTFGVLLPDIDRLWRDWWSLASAGRAVAALQYLSCLIYGEDDNPIFAPWTPDAGGGSPCLWDYTGFLYEDRWLPANLDSLRELVTPARVRDVLERASGVLAKGPARALAAQMLADLGSRADRLRARCRELPERLADKSSPGRILDWLCS